MILGIVGSYRKRGTIDQAVSSVLAAARTNGAETKKIYLKDLNIGFCNNCRRCTQEPGEVGKGVGADSFLQDRSPRGVTRWKTSNY